MGIKRDVEAVLGQVKEKGWNNMTAEEKKGLLEALIELLMQHGILQKNSERIAEMLKQSLDDAAAGKEADVLAKFAKDIRKEPRFTKNGYGVLQNEIKQIKEDMEDCFWLTAMNTEQMALLINKIADGNANAEVMIENDRITEAALIKYIDQLDGIHKEAKRCRKETEKKNQRDQGCGQGDDWELDGSGIAERYGWTFHRVSYIIQVESKVKSNVNLYGKREGKIWVYSALAGKRKK